MVTLQGIPSAVIDTITRKLGLQTAVERSTFDLINSIQPVIIADEKSCDIVKAVTSAGTIYTTPTDKKFYLTYATLALEGYAGRTATITITPQDGAAVVILTSKIQTSTEITCSENSIATNFSVPILLLKGSNIVVAGDGTSSSIAGYTETD